MERHLLPSIGTVQEAMDDINTDGDGLYLIEKEDFDADPTGWMYISLHFGFPHEDDLYLVSADNLGKYSKVLPAKEYIFAYRVRPKGDYYYEPVSRYNRENPETVLFTIDQYERLDTHKKYAFDLMDTMYVIESRSVDGDWRLISSEEYEKLGRPKFSLMCKLVIFT